MSKVYSSAPSEYFLLGDWAVDGVPNYLHSVESIEPDVLNRTLKNIPERSNVPKTHPTYFDDNVPTTILIQSSDINFGGADVFASFLYEGAGYKNAVGYYVYALNDGYEVPTKWEGSKWTPMTREDFNAVDRNGKSVVKKTLIFPNTSLPTWANLNGKNGQAGGGNLLPGSKVRLLYDTSRPESLFPNNTGIGFFVIPNGFSGGSVKNSGTPLYSHPQYNPGEYKQIIQLADVINADSRFGDFVIAFEDITRTSSGCDNDFNDVILRVSLTPTNCVNLDRHLILPAGEDLKDFEVIFDRTGMYITLTNASILRNQALDCKEFNFRFDITPKKDQQNLEMDQLEDILKKIRFNSNVTLSVHNETEREETEEYYFSKSAKSFTITLKVPKENLQNYMYFFNSITNIDNQSIFDKHRSILVEIQAYLVNKMDEFVFGRLAFAANGDDEKVSDLIDEKTYSPQRVNLVNPFSMGDPHIQTITGEKFDLPHDDGTYVLYEDASLCLRTKLNKFSPNNDSANYSHLRFMEFLGIMYKKEKIVVNLFHKDTYYLDEACSQRILSHEFFQVQNESEMTPISLMRRKYHEAQLRTKQFHLRYIRFKSSEHGDVILELLFIPHRCDTVNSVSVLCSNLHALQLGQGAFVNRKLINCESIFR